MKEKHQDIIGLIHILKYLQMKANLRKMKELASLPNHASSK